jgi:hypothetical protein
LARGLKEAAYSVVGEVQIPFEVDRHHLILILERSHVLATSASFGAKYASIVR